MLSLLLSQLYNLFLHFSYALLHLVSFKNKKIKNWLIAQKELKLNSNIPNFKECYWIHAASVGEFELSIPLIQQIKNHEADIKIVVSFFSVSGINFYKQHHLVDDFFLFPKDFKSNIQFIIDKIHPKALIIIKHERWFNLIKTTTDNNIPIFAIEVDNKKNNLIYSLYLKYINQFINKIFFTTNGSLKIEAVKTVEAFHLNSINEFKNNQITICLGSCYIEEVKLIAKYYNQYKNLKIILCPHDIEANTFSIYQELFDEPIGKFSNNEFGYNILFIDKMRILKHLYRYVDFAFIGGGFNKNGIHNIFEAAVVGNIIIAGNNSPFDDLQTEAINQKLIYLIENYSDLENVLNLFIHSSNLRNENKEKWCNFFKLHHSISETIYKDIQSKL